MGSLSSLIRMRSEQGLTPIAIVIIQNDEVRPQGALMTGTDDLIDLDEVVI